MNKQSKFVKAECCTHCGWVIWGRPVKKNIGIFCSPSCVILHTRIVLKRLSEVMQDAWL